MCVFWKGVLKLYFSWLGGEMVGGRDGGGRYLLTPLTRDPCRPPRTTVSRSFLEESDIDEDVDIKLPGMRTGSGRKFITPEFQPGNRQRH